jgi:hypothetical protein
MRFFKIIFLVLFIAVIHSCSLTKQVNELNQNASTAISNGDYKSALSFYEEIIEIHTSKQKEVDGDIYRKAGLTAWELNEVSKTIEYLEKAKQALSADAKSYATIGKAYNAIDNLSREIVNLEFYLENFPVGDDFYEVQNQIFLAYVESQNWDKANNIWQTLNTDIKSKEEYLTGYLKVCKALSNESLLKIASDLLKINPNSIEALETLAIHYYQISEDRYQKEMLAYEQNKTNRQYRLLLVALEEINANYRTSRDYLEQLYKLNPTPRFATLLGNIYTRFDNKQRADYYYRRAKN